MVIQQPRVVDTSPSIRVRLSPAIEPITMSEAKKQLEIAGSDSAHDAHIERLIGAVREEWEQDTSVATITQTVEHVQPRWQACIRLTVRPVQSITSVKYLDSDEAEVTVDPANYSLDVARRLLRFKGDYSPPITSDEWNAWRIEYVAGYGDTPNEVPQMDRSAMLLLLGYRFENRDMLSNELVFNRTAYEAMVAKRMRGDYP